MYLLDTNVASELGRHGRRDQAVVRWAWSIPHTQFFLSVASLSEIEVGVLLMERRDQRQGSTLRRWFEENLIPTFAGRILDYDQAVARRCARLHVPNKRPVNDAIIAATAIVHGLTVVTRNVTDFEPTGVPLLNPWEP